MCSVPFQQAQAKKATRFLRVKTANSSFCPRPPAQCCSMCITTGTVVEGAIICTGPNVAILFSNKYV